jgi:hypothetical protein
MCPLMLHERLTYDLQITVLKRIANILEVVFGIEEFATVLAKIVFSYLMLLKTL